MLLGTDIIESGFLYWFWIRGSSTSRLLSIFEGELEFIEFTWVAAFLSPGSFFSFSLSLSLH
jgi:hypothetical protein